MGRGFYPNLQTLEIACGLDAVVQGIDVAYRAGRELEGRMLRAHAKNALAFLKFAQDQVPADSAGAGGLGYGGVQVFEQRLDVTGHAVAALTKFFWVRGGQTCQP
mmetsp:Transcript_5041/g.10599  ORF Transcript_5041/g.10599 Transcript_5041/m.10599 type:complete len:105 (-) Transcript_5041:114-428(-)